MSKSKITNFLIAFIILLGVSLGGYFYYKLSVLEKDPIIKNQKEAKALISKIGKLYLLPLDENPTIATVVDPNLLKDKAFFTLSEEGDKVLIYEKSGKAILYRPRIDRIIEVVSVRNTATEESSQVNESNSTNDDKKEKVN